MITSVHRLSLMYAVCSTIHN